MPTFDEHFYQREQPQTFCPVTAAFLDSLHLCTKSGLMLMNSLLQDVYTFKELKKWTPAFQIWHAFARGLPVATKFSPISRKSIPRHCAHIRTSVNQLQTDMNRLLAAPSNLTIQQLPLLLYNFPNLMDWLHHTREFRLLQIRRTIQYLINLDEGLLQDLDIQVEPADYVAEWVISRRVARSTIGPGHFAKFCARNPYRGVARRDLPPEAMVLVNAIAFTVQPPLTHPHSGNATSGTTTPNSVTHSSDASLAGTSITSHTSHDAELLQQSGQLLTKQSNLSTSTIYSSNTTSASGPVTTTHLGPTYQPIYKPKSKPKSTNTDHRYGQLAISIPPPYRHSGRTTPSNRSASSKTKRQRSSSPEHYDGGDEYTYDDVAEYNMSGEGHPDI
ncbi:hypothetical protein AGABI1DRAFT_96114 [Agaricus bisporus var. burnettii JB137-S8]|uniref:Uncharacterized protein n=1 Tax=Agaricus bisporus var. burnettii (strain JB137-S8 / ATCC MYA-4627 / FGSC 10392) TaxID=597362 RepID=K5WEQ1_AGABU|nr:uncharacterized protein AGABI1DRAFT_96114 [Agaricus bisporus var. burnettii JB137-S8]EKM73726.1 hypothetical protein AGABI1DRAFT_96114 [Agaricus bisporus var. burnettii JB137-S8]